MDINSLINTRTLLTPISNPLNLKVGQQLDVKVVNAQIQAAKNEITLTLGGKNITVTSNRPLSVNVGQDLKIQVTQTAPVIQFKIIPSAPDKNQSQDVRLTLLPTLSTTKEGVSVPVNKAPPTDIATISLTENQPLDAKITGITGNKIQLLIANPATVDINNKQNPVITIERNQLSNPPSTLQIGQKLNLEITKPGITPEFKSVASAGNQTVAAKVISLSADKIQLQIAQPDKQAVTIEQNQLSNAPLNLKVGQNLRLEIIKTGNSQVFNVIPAPPQALAAKITGLNSNSIQLQIANGNKPATLLTIDRAQISNAPVDLKIGQTLHLDIIKTSPTLEFKITPSAANNISETKIADYIKQFLPRHEVPPILLNQLIKDLPQLMNNESVSKTLKQIAAQIIQNLPPKEQLITKQGLRQAINNSGLFLEAKLSGTMAQLPQLIDNESVPLSLQRIAAEIVQNLSPFATSVDPDPVFLIPKAVDKEAASQLLKVTEPDLAPMQQEDFKANLLKFIHALKQELSQQNQQPLQQADLDLLKNLQNKTENTVAKIVLDQLMSVPTDNSPKQIWTINLPFMDRQQAETVKIEIQQDRESKQHNGNPDWSVNITVSPPKLDTIHCIVSYSNKVINTFFKSHNTQTTELIKHNLDYLKQQLEDSGLTTGHMDAHADTQKTPLPPPQLLGKKLFDDKA